VSESNALWESIWNSSAKSWYSEDISKGLDPVAAGSYLTAYTWFEHNGVQRIRVYYQRQDGYIREAAFDSGRGWGKGVEPAQGFPQARSGTGLAIVPFPDTNEWEAKLYYQNMGGKLISFDYKPKTASDGSWQNQDRQPPRSIPENGYKISTNKFPLNSNRRPRIYTRRNTSYCRTQQIWRHDATNILHPRRKIGRNPVEEEGWMAVMEHARCRSARCCRSILFWWCPCLLPEQDGIPLSSGPESVCEQVAIHWDNIEPASEVALACHKNLNNWTLH